MANFELKVFDDLYSTFTRDEAIANMIVSPNPEDTDEIKIAMVGFAYNNATELWEMDEYVYVRDLLVASKGFSLREKLFYAFGLSYILGLFRSGKIDVLDFKVGIAQLPGYIFAKGGRF